MVTLIYCSITNFMYDPSMIPTLVITVNHTLGIHLSIIKDTAVDRDSLQGYPLLSQRRRKSMQVDQTCTKNFELLQYDHLLLQAYCKHFNSTMIESSHKMKGQIELRTSRILIVVLFSCVSVSLSAALDVSLTRHEFVYPDSL